MNGRVVIAGALAQRPWHGGHTWVFLQYLLGFRRLGWDVLFLDRLEPGEGHADADRAREVLRSFGLEDSCAVLCDGRTVGLPRDEVLSFAGESAFLLNVMGFLDDEEILGAVPRRVFLDIDPGFGQMWRELGLHDAFAGHDAFVTVGENVGRPGCGIPTCGLPWITTPQPVVLDLWPVSADVGAHFTSVGAWRGPYGPVEYDGRTFGLRVHEFRRFAGLPHLTDVPFELALEIDPAERADLELLETNHWSLVDPRAVAGDPWAYRDYIRRSRAEFMVAKNMYVQTGSGWFSDRSICYLASGKPVLAQDTGLNGRYPTGEGILTFSTLDEAAAGAEEICRDYPRHARAARAIAEEHFDSDRVLTRLLEELDVH